MAEFESQTGFEPFGVAPPAAPRVLAVFDLRPLSTGEILDRTFTLYRQRFWLYTGISAIAAAVTTLGTGLRLTYGLGGERLTGRDGLNAVWVSGAITIVTSLLYLLAYCQTQAATVSAVSAAYLGEDTSVATALRTVRKRWYRYILIGLWQGCSMLWLPAVLLLAGGLLAAFRGLGLQWLSTTFIVLGFLSFIYAPFAYIRNSLGIVASVAEDLKVRAAMRRSKVLVAGHKGRVFVVLLLMWALSIVAGIAQGIPALLLIRAHSIARIALEALTLVTTFVSGSLVAPVGAIAFCIFYVDERVRKEGYDVETLMNRMAEPLGSPAEVTPPMTDAEYSQPHEAPGAE